MRCATAAGIVLPPRPSSPSPAPCDPASRFLPIWFNFFAVPLFRCQNRLWWRGGVHGRVRRLSRAAARPLPVVPGPARPDASRRPTAGAMDVSDPRVQTLLEAHRTAGTVPRRHRGRAGRRGCGGYWRANWPTPAAGSAGPARRPTTSGRSKKCSASVSSRLEAGFAADQSSPSQRADRNEQSIRLAEAIVATPRRSAAGRGDEAPAGLFCRRHRRTDGPHRNGRRRPVAPWPDAPGCENCSMPTQ